ncbi:MAG: oligopeptidase [Actinomycetota bacterium]|jgi:oligopeptidase B
MQPPAAPRRPTVLEQHGDERVDDWYWLRDKDDPEVIAHLEAENAYTAEQTEHTRPLEHALFDEIKARILETDLSVPAPWGGYWYYTRTVEGLQYPIHCRRSGAEDGPEQVLLDENELAGDADFFAIGAFSVSPDHRLLAYSTDFDGDEVFTLRFRDLDSGEDLGDEIPGASYGATWALDNTTVFYTVLNDAKRPWRVYRHNLGVPADSDVLVHQEDDEAFYVGIGRSRSDEWLVLSMQSMVTSEARVLPAHEPHGEFRMVEPRRHGVEYDVDQHGDRFLIVTNDEAENFRLVEAPLATPGREHWTDVLPHRPDVKLDGVDAFAHHLALYERADAVRRLRIMDTETGEIHAVEQPEAVSTASGGTNLEYDTDVLRFGYTSLVTPSSVFDYEVRTRARTLKKQQPVLGGYDPTEYVTERLWATADDGERVPISIVRRADVALDGSAPALLYGYGSYEASRDPAFSSIRLSLLDRGFVYAIAHIRGGGEMGRRWYENGKFLHKRNTFTDFIAAAETLVEREYTTPERLVARGGSAGGLLMGAVANLRPDLFRAMVAEVPFVDVLTTILDESLPLTVIEWDEWGNPNQREFYDYIKSYSPYDNVRAVDYPRILATAGLNDPRVSYWEPAKWVQKLRVTKTDDHPVLLKVEMGAGHMGPSGRYDAWKDEAFVLAFVLDAVGITA